MDNQTYDRAEDSLLLVPGPTPVPGRVLRASSRGMMNHRCPAFHDLLKDVTAGLKLCFRTNSDPLILTASGTGGLEAAVVNTLSPGDRVLAVITGQFGKRFADIAEAYGAAVDRLEVPWGSAADPAAVKAALNGHKAVLSTLNETSTGVVNPVEAITKVAHDGGALSLVDAISGLLATPLEHDAWGCDVTVAGSQKAFMIPPGLSFVAVSERAWAAYAEAKMPRFYFDLDAARKSYDKFENPWTPAVSLIYALAEALEIMAEEGFDAMLTRHLRLRNGVRGGAAKLGLVPIAEESCASPAVTALRMPAGIDERTMRGRLREVYGVEVAGGQGHLKGKIIRIGHLGAVHPQQVLQGLAMLGQALVDLGQDVNPSAAVAAAAAAMAVQ